MLPAAPLLSAHTGAVHSELSLSHIGAGYGYYRSNLTLFDPGWHGEQPKGPEDAGTVDLGNDPIGVLDRQVAMAGWAEPC